MLGELLAQPEQRSGTLRFAFHSIFGRATTVSVEGVADYDRQRYVSRLEVDQPDTVYDTAVIAGFRYEKLVSIKVPGGGGPDFKPQWSSPERWSPRASAPSIPYVPLPFIGEAHSDVRRDVSGFDDARRRGVLDAVLTGFSRIGASTQRGTPTVQYRLTFDRDRAKAVLAPESARGVPRIGPEAPALQEVDVWIDHSGRLRRYIWPTWVGTTLDFELWDHGKPAPVEVPSDLKVRQDGVPDERERQLAERSLVSATDLAGYATASTAAVESTTYARCWDDGGLLGAAGRDRTAAAQSPAYRRGSTYVASAVVLARTPAAGMAAYGDFEDTAMLSCIAGVFQGAVEGETGQIALSSKSEVVRDPPLADQSIAYRLDLGIGRSGRREPESHRLLQVTILRKGRGLALLFAASTGSPFPEDERRRLASVVTGRLPT